VIKIAKLKNVKTARVEGSNRRGTVKSYNKGSSKFKLKTHKDMNTKKEY